MIFCRTKATARELAIRMAEEKHSVRELTAALDIEQRRAIINQFRQEMFRVLISTNVTVRGKFIFIIFFLVLLI
jgi:ATP-dependent RNA helicase DeaD